MNEQAFIDIMRLWHARNHQRLDEVARNAGLTSEAYLLKTLRIAVSEVLTVGNLTLEVNDATCFCEGKKIILTKAEFDVLTVLMRNENRLVSSSVLNKAGGWSHNGESRGLSFLIYKLRQKTKASAVEIITARGRGYRIQPKTSE